ncbi:MAG: hypothetical protein JSW58_17085 [Candidatus Latescibacterota bacterium]|nr:MAG: hypothetical protein JSW58_17085 [Candidatus Latescibacterota bacterium]
MKAMRSLTMSIVVVGVIALAFGVLFGCSAKEEAEPQATEETGEAQTEQAEQPAEAAEAEVVAYDNPKEGICPVCQMKVEEGHIEVAKIDDKNYACCSARCVTMLTENPVQYLTQEEEAGHEGHQH